MTEDQLIEKLKRIEALFAFTGHDWSSAASALWKSRIAA